MEAKYDVFSCMSESQLIGKKTILPSCYERMEYTPIEINRTLKKLAEYFNHVHYIDPNAPLCPNDECYVITNDNSVYSDTKHLSIYGAEVVGKYIFDEIEKTKKGEQKHAFPE